MQAASQERVLALCDGAPLSALAFKTDRVLVQAVQAVCRGNVERAFAVVRPPGHHAECARAMGFCFYNNVAVAALAARQEKGIERVLVLDWDVHHGESC